MSHHDDFETEPVPGLPANLPEGEAIAWQGRPDAAAIARHVLHRNKVAIYFAALVAWRVMVGLYDGLSATIIFGNVAWTLVLAAAAIAILSVIAYGMARTTVYTITNKRVVMRIGVALPVTFNLPFSQILSADLARLPGGYGTIALTLKEHTKISWAVLWPHARPWKFAKPQPALRCLPDVVPVANLLADNLRAAHGQAEAEAQTTGLQTQAGNEAQPQATPKTVKTPNTARKPANQPKMGKLQPEGA